MGNSFNIAVGMSTCNMAAGSRILFQTLEKEGFGDDLSIMGCLGMCHAEPQIQITDSRNNTFLYQDLNPEKLNRIIRDHLRGGTPIEKWLFKSDEGIGPELLGKQRRIVLGNCGRINPENIDEYLAADGYKALESVLKQNDPMAICKTVLASGLRGRGGGRIPDGDEVEVCVGRRAE
ncbi:hypothetical protein P9H32_14775 [Pontiella sp. NLcol2]|uniref:NADH-quinone oxidoreductase subunit F n=1 Tax=Pontiella agarivorans TaxID=3038953 RepID=A0ABU5N0Y0_9BACT|nr:hypothetical protein [Pontiella agarivorans]MDZ8119891.1 hypothetical protein [Pontiella agarivorans]